ncbi:unnamed protein product [Rhodiola kirilowii]
MSSSRLTFVLLSAILLLADLVVSQSPTFSPLPSPTPPKKKTPVMVPAASPTPSNKKTPVEAPAPNVPDYMAPGPSTTETDCMTLLAGAFDCLSYVQEGSNLTEPDKACCPELATLVNTNPICLCQLLTKKGNSLGIPIDMTRALALPGACKVEVPDPRLCAVINGSPTDAPGSSPTDGLSPTGAVLPPPTGAVLPPTSVNNDNGGAVAIVGSSASSFLVALVAVAAAAYTWNMF